MAIPIYKGNALGNKNKPSLRAKAEKEEPRRGTYDE